MLIRKRSAFVPAFEDNGVAGIWPESPFLKVTYAVYAKHTNLLQ